MPHAADNEPLRNFFMCRIGEDIESLKVKIHPAIKLSSSDLVKRLNDISTEIKRNGGHVKFIDASTYETTDVLLGHHVTEENILEFRDSALRVFSKSGVNRVSYVVMRAWTEDTKNLEEMAAHVCRLMSESGANATAENVKDSKSPVEAIYVEDGKVMVLRSGKWEVETGNMVSEFIRLSSK